VFADDHQLCDYMRAGSIPKELGALSNLESLQLGDSELSGKILTV